MSRFALALILIAAPKVSFCSKVEPRPHVDAPPLKQAPEPKAEPPKTDEPKADEPDEPEVPEVPALELTADKCVDDCVQRNQMRAVGPEQIAADCRRQCEADG